MFLETNDTMYEFLSSFDDEYTTTCPKCCTLSPSGVDCTMCTLEDNFNHLNSLDTEPDPLFCWHSHNPLLVAQVPVGDYVSSM